MTSFWSQQGTSVTVFNPGIVGPGISGLKMRSRSLDSRSGDYNPYAQYYTVMISLKLRIITKVCCIAHCNCIASVKHVLQLPLYNS